MAGEINSRYNTFRLQSTSWIKRPMGYQSHDLEGQLTANGSTINGRIMTTGCAHFVLSRK
jgi:hypothetical protein